MDPPRARCDIRRMRSYASRSTLALLAACLGALPSCAEPDVEGPASESSGEDTATVSSGLSTPASATRGTLPVIDMSVARTSLGTLSVIGRRSAADATNGDVWSTWQTQPNGGWAGGWTRAMGLAPLGNADYRTFAASRTDGQLELVWTDEGRFCHGPRSVTTGLLTFLACEGDARYVVGRPVAQVDGRLVAMNGRLVGSVLNVEVRRQRPITAQTPDNWETLETWNDFDGTDLFLVRDNGGRLHAFGRGYGGAYSVPLWHRYQLAPNGAAWSAPESIAVDASPGLALGSPHFAVATNTDGRFEIVVNGVDGAFWHRWQTSPTLTGSWSAWTRMPGLDSVQMPLLARNADGRLEIFGVTPGSNWVVSRAQTTAGGGWGSWRALMDTSVGPLDVGTNLDGRLEIFSVHPTTRLVQHRWQVGVGVW